MSPSIELKESVVIHLTKAAIVSTKPCWLCFAHSYASGGAERLYRFHNGFNVSSEVIVFLHESSTNPARLFLRYPVFFNKGLFVNFLTAGRHITVGYIPVR